ncbi:2OG-Fe(II) oxygenase [Streptomyces morookaense]|uniref:2OG-Fe(II) oxygenase n=1 Tax=Streptomyces morookaense TaxID=1970 RepID=A0A7Y7B239_STRMO|nr:2OG-Fe(II) oxygenase [Streptomyces morookaense]NVK77623.1 2OG-Fe(II) oxygenase [Streptomyces morookaense]
MSTTRARSRRSSALNLPRTATGFDQVLHAVRARPPRRAPDLPGEPRWRSDFVVMDPRGPRVRLQEFGYTSRELGRGQGRLDDTALVGPVQILTPEGLACLTEVCDRLEGAAGASRFIATRRVRSADLMSAFINNMIRDRTFLLTCSRLVGVPLIPHPLRIPTAQINYFEGRGPGARPDIVRWHRDGMDYVFTIQLNGYEDYEGGRFSYFRGRTDEFDGVQEGDPRIREADCGDRGATLFLHGSRIFHAVTPVTRGRRVTLVVSFFCPYFARQDSNTFWHLAGDDGIPATIPCWLRLKWPVRDAAMDYALRAGSPVVTWEDVR